jgi:hypothetical protein
MQHNGTSYSLTEENILNGLGSGLVQSTILSQNTAVVSKNEIEILGHDILSCPSLSK